METPLTRAEHIDDRYRRYISHVILLLLVHVCAIACHDSVPDDKEITPLKIGANGLTSDELLDPLTCQSCHPHHYAEWRASVHAFASEDPVFRALNELGQTETNGALGDFCVRCHAPVALALDQTTDGLNLSEVDHKYQGITCAFCHQISAVNGTHNNPLTWANDGIMRGGLSTPEPNSVHRSKYTQLLDGSQLESSQMCGACHDIVTPTKVHLEQTYLEWLQSLFSSPDSTRRNSCADCHMPTRRLPNPSTAQTTYHDHLMPAVDLVSNNVHAEALQSLSQRSLIEEVKAELELTLLSELCGEIGVDGGGDFEVYLENVSAGHRFPSGAALDRRLWAELTVTDIDGHILYTSGAITAEQPVVKAALDDPQLWVLRDQAFNAAGEETHRFWDIASVVRNTLPPSTLLSRTNENFEESHVLHRYRFGTELPIYEVRLRIFLRPIALELLNELVNLELLNEEVLLNMPTYELSTATRIWRADEALLQGTLSGRTLLCTPL